jgi:hypothetical protein
MFGGFSSTSKINYVNMCILYIYTYICILLDYIVYIIYYISYIKINETRTQYDAIPNLCGRQARGAKIAFELHSRFQTDTPAFSKLLKSATLNQEMEFKARAIPSMLEMKCMEFVMVGLLAVYVSTVSRSLGTLVGGNHQRAHAETRGLCGPAVAQLNPDPWPYAIKPCWNFSAMADGNYVLKKPSKTMNSQA